MLKAQFGVLDKIKKEYAQVDDDLYTRIKKALKYEFTNKDDKSTFFSLLPPKLRMDLSYIIQKNRVATKINFFKNKDKPFVVYVTQLLKAYKVLKDGYIFEEGDPADNIFFLTKGSAAFFLHDKKETPYLLFEEGSPRIQ